MTEPFSPESAMQHFMSITWQFQGPDFMDNLRDNAPHVKHLFEDWHLGLGPVRDLVVLGAGPSMDVRLRSSACPDAKVFACDRAYSKMSDEPDAVFVLEATPESLTDLAKWWDGKPKTCDLVTVPYADPGLLDLWPRDRIRWVLPLVAFPEMARAMARLGRRCGAKSFQATGSTVGVFASICAYNVLKAHAPSRLWWTGMDSCLYERPSEVHAEVVTRDGKTAYLPWNFFIAQYELKSLAGTVAPLGVQCINAGDGLLHGPAILAHPARVEDPS